jgi:hypothetical protein
MKAITVCEPYATLIARGIKRVENRTWPAHASIIGQRIAIHAGKSKAWLTPDNYGIPTAELTFGAVVATATLADCICIGDATDARLVKIGWSMKGFFDHEHTEGPFCWVLSDARPLAKPIPYSGAQGIWNLPDNLIGEPT